MLIVSLSLKKIRAREARRKARRSSAKRCPALCATARKVQIESALLADAPHDRIESNP